MSSVDEKHRESLIAITQYIANQHPDLLRSMIAQHRLSLSNSVSKFHKDTVAYGPFKGLKLQNDAHWGMADRGSMILGFYEQEILKELSKIQRKKYFIDLGAADGYYGVGVLVNSIFDISYCYEITEKGRKTISDNALLNGVADRVVIKGEATRNFFQEIPAEALDDSVMLIDIEGAEFDLMSKEAFSAFKNSTIFIEIHDWVESAAEKIRLLIDQSSATHTLLEIATSSRDLSSYRELRSMNDSDRWLLCSEGRPRLMTWFKFTPIQKISKEKEGTTSP